MNSESDPTVHQEIDDEMRPEYDFSGGVRGKYYEAYQKSRNVIILDPDVAAVFPDSAAVNEALRLLVKAAQTMKD
jgi:hypothetical protein